MKFELFDINSAKKISEMVTGKEDDHLKYLTNRELNDEAKKNSKQYWNNWYKSLNNRVIRAIGNYETTQNNGKTINKLSDNAKNALKDMGIYVPSNADDTWVSNTLIPSINNRDLNGILRKSYKPSSSGQTVESAKESWAKLSRKVPVGTRKQKVGKNIYNEHVARYGTKGNASDNYTSNSHGTSKRTLTELERIANDTSGAYSGEQKRNAQDILNRNASASMEIFRNNPKAGDVRIRTPNDVVTSQRAIYTSDLPKSEIKSIRKNNARAIRGITTSRIKSTSNPLKKIGYAIQGKLAADGNRLATTFGNKDGLIPDLLSGIGRSMTKRNTGGEEIYHVDPIKDKSMRHNAGLPDNKKKNNKPTVITNATAQQALDYSRANSICDYYQHQSFSTPNMVKLTELSTNGFPNPVKLGNTVQDKLSVGDYKDINNYRIQPNIMSLDDIESWLKSPAGSLF